MKKYLDDLEATIQDRKNKDPQESYVASLFEEKEKIISKIKEESEELAEAFRENDPSSIKHESADLLFHLMVSSTHLMNCGSLSGPNMTRAIIEIMKSSKKPIENIIGYLYLLL